MHGALPYLAKPKDKPQERARAGKRLHREPIVRRIADILDAGQPTRFALEGPCRAGLRSQLCLDGERWATADKFAATVVELALARIGAVRPRWQDGQPEARETEHHFCKHCGKQIADERRARGARYCSQLCVKAAYEARLLRTGESYDRARHEAALATRRAARIRTCPACGEQFSARTRARHDVYCSIECWMAVKRAARMRTCPTCGEQFDTRPPGCKGARVYCSRDCWLTTNRTLRRGRPLKANGFASEAAE